MTVKPLPLIFPCVFPKRLESVFSETTGIFRTSFYGKHRGVIRPFLRLVSRKFLISVSPLPFLPLLITVWHDGLDRPACKAGAHIWHRHRPAFMHMTGDFKIRACRSASASITATATATGTSAIDLGYRRCGEKETGIRRWGVP